MSRLERTGSTANGKGEIVDAEFVEIDDDGRSFDSGRTLPPPAGQPFEGRSATSKLIFLGIPLLILSMCSIAVLSDPSGTETVTPIGDVVEIEGQRVGPDPVQETSSPPQEVADQRRFAAIVLRCYNLDNCTAARISSLQPIEDRDGERLLKANVEYGRVLDPDTANKIQWSGKAEEIFALCSKRTPAIAWAAADGFLAETFDFGGNGIPGAQEDNAALYDAMCHAGDSSWRSNARSLGYQALADGGGQFEIDKPEQLFVR